MKMLRSKKTAMILGTVGALLIMIASFIIVKRVFFKYEYTQKDIDRTINILLEKENPTKRDYKLYDLDKNKKISLYDLTLVCKEVK